MKTRRSTIVNFMLFALVVSACQTGNGRKEPSAPELIPTAVNSSTQTPTRVPTPSPTQVNYSDSIKDFAGKWIGYSVIPLKPVQAVGEKPGIRLEIAADRFVVDGQTCEAPKYELKTITLKEFLAGLQQPDMSFELNQEEFPLLQSGCKNLEPSSVSLVNPRTLAARIENDILYFERDASVSRNDMAVVTDLVSDSSIKPKYEIHAQVPQVELTNAKSFNQAARSIVDKELTGFKKNFVNWQIPTEMAAASSFMWIGYDVPLLTSDLVSIRFTVDYYMAGAAHPNHYFRVLNYDLVANKEILFSDLFKDPEKALKVLSLASKKSLSKPDFPLFEEGILPKMENFTNWNLTEENLRLSFDPYQVAPYAAGPQEVLLPNTDIQDLVKSNSVAGKMILGQ